MDVLTALGVGLGAGAIGTAALTIAETAEMRLTGRESSTVPGQVGARLVGRDPDANEGLVARLNPVVHWAHGIALGAVRGLLDVAGLGAERATLAFYPLVWGGDAALYRALGIAPAPWRWGASELLTDLFGKGVYAVATSAAYIVLDQALQR